MLRRPEPNKERVEPTNLSTIAIDITHLTRFDLLLLLPNNSGRNLDLNKIRFLHLHYILQYSFGLDLNLENFNHFTGIWKRLKVTV